MIMQKRWRPVEADDNFIKELREGLGISPVLAKVLADRGIGSVQEGKHFLHDTPQDMHDPFALKDMEKAARRLVQAVQQKEHIVIYGDYDVDGITSTALLCSVLQDLGAKPAHYIPERMHEGYGLNGEALEKLAQEGTELLVTVDCGISSYDDVARFQEQMDIIITDHHEAPPKVPPAFAVVNPKQPDCPYPYKGLAGAGVAYKLCQALWQLLRGEPLVDYMELAALGTIADLVPLTGENRVLVKEGLRRMKGGRNVGLQALLRVSGLEGKELTAGRIAFTAAPRLNAAGRISHADQGVRLLMEKDPTQADVLAAVLDDMNRQRQDIEKAIASQAVQQLEDNGHSQDGVLIAYGPEWHPGVIGIAASRLVERFYRPSLVIGVSAGIGRGSCRSIAGFNMYEALTAASDLLIKYGGHPMAAGFSIEESRIEAFRERLNAYAAAHMKAEDYQPCIDIDMDLAPAEVSLELIDELALLEPYGMGNSRPVFSLSDRFVTACRPIGRTKEHLRFAVDDGKGGQLSGVGWSMADLCRHILEGDRAALAFTLEKNEFNGTCTAQMVLQDVHSTEPPIQLNRSVMIDVYKGLRTLLDGRELPVWQVQQRLMEHLAPMDGHRVCAALQVLLEIGVLQEGALTGEPMYSLPALKGKMSLSTSPAYIRYGGE